MWKERLILTSCFLCYAVTSIPVHFQKLINNRLIKETIKTTKTKTMHVKFIEKCAHRAADRRECVLLRRDKVLSECKGRLTSQSTLH